MRGSRFFLKFTRFLHLNFKIAKKKFKIVICHIQNENFTGSGLEGTPKLSKPVFSRLFLCQNYKTLEVPTRAVFGPLN